MAVLVILALLWAAVLLPPLLRSRTQRAASSIVDFNRKLDVLGRTNDGLDVDENVTVPPGSGAVPAVPMMPLPSAIAASRSAKRRRDVLRVLTVVVTLTLLLAAVTGAVAAWALQIAADGAMVAYLGLWAWLRNAQAERIEKVRYLPQPRRTPPLVLRRSVSS